MSSHYLDNPTLEKLIADFKICKKNKFKYELILEDIAVSIENNCNKKDMFENKKAELKSTMIKYEDIYNQLANAFLTLAENLVRYKKFSLVDFDDAVQEFIIICFEKLDKFDPTYVGKSGKKSKAFNYITTCIINHYKQLYRTARNYNEFKKKYQNSLMTQQENCRPKKKKLDKYYAS